MVRSVTRLTLFGFCIWAIPFLVGMVIFAVVPPTTALFDTIVTLSLAVAATIASIRWRTPPEMPIADAIVLVTWTLIPLAIDIPIFVFGPDTMRMPASEYFADIGLSYLLIPIVFAGHSAVTKITKQ